MPKPPSRSRRRSWIRTIACSWPRSMPNGRSSRRGVVPRRKKVGLDRRGENRRRRRRGSSGAVALKPRTVPPQVLTSIAVALRDNNPRVRAEAVNLASLLGPVSCCAAGPAEAGDDCVRRCRQRADRQHQLARGACSPCRYAGARATALSQCGAGAVRSDELPSEGLDAMAALEGLAGIGHPTSVSIFEELLTNSNADMRRFAVEGLARIGHRDALAALQQMGQSERSGQRAAGAALREREAWCGGRQPSADRRVAAVMGLSVRSCSGTCSISSPSWLRFWLRRC